MTKPLVGLTASALLCLMVFSATVAQAGNSYGRCDAAIKEIDRSFCDALQLDITMDGCTGVRTLVPKTTQTYMPPAGYTQGANGLTGQPDFKGWHFVCDSITVNGVSLGGGGFSATGLIIADDIQSGPDYFVPEFFADNADFITLLRHFGADIHEGSFVDVIATGQHNFSVVSTSVVYDFRVNDSGSMGTTTFTDSLIQGPILDPVMISVRGVYEINQGAGFVGTGIGVMAPAPGSPFSGLGDPIDRPSRITMKVA